MSGRTERNKILEERNIILDGGLMYFDFLMRDKQHEPVIHSD
jgi:hypothetical protein